MKNYPFFGNVINHDINYIDDGDLDQHQANAQTVRSIQNQIYAQSESSIV